MTQEELLVILGVLYAGGFIALMIGAIRSGSYSKKIYNLMINQEKRWVRLHNEKLNKEKDSK